MKHLISSEYKEKIVAHHTKSKGKWGGSVNHKQPMIHKYMLLSDAKSVLDYGSGSSAFKNGIKQMYPDYKYTIHEYEPGIIGKDEDPPVCDVTICYDVLEHIEPDKIDNVLQHIYDKTNKWFICNISCVPSFGAFGDGSNLHLLVKRPEWWVKKLSTEKWDVLEMQTTEKSINMLLKKEYK